MLKMIVKVKIEDSNGGMIYKDFAADEIRFKKSGKPEKDDEEEKEFSE